MFVLKFKTPKRKISYSFLLIPCVGSSKFKQLFKWRKEATRFVIFSYVLHFSLFAILLLRCLWLNPHQIYAILCIKSSSSISSPPSASKNYNKVGKISTSGGHSQTHDIIQCMIIKNYFLPTLIYVGCCWQERRTVRTMSSKSYHILLQGIHREWDSRASI